jgi:DNA/RNA-binding domain of Phe-tRNA-synthetase-like protein
MSAEQQPVVGAVDPFVAAELPGLELWELESEGGDGPTAPEVRRRLRDLAGRWSGAKAIALRGQPVPQAYRVLLRQLGVDPDTTRSPIEDAILGRLQHGGFRTQGRVADAMLLAVVETSVPVAVLDAEKVVGELELRAARAGEQLGEGPLADDLVPGRLVLADDRGPFAELFGPPLPERLPTRASTRVRLCAVRAPGVPVLHVEEALWIAADVLAIPR